MALCAAMLWPLSTPQQSSAHSLLFSDLFAEESSSIIPDVLDTRGLRDTAALAGWVTPAALLDAEHQARLLAAANRLLYLSQPQCEAASKVSAAHAGSACVACVTVTRWRAAFPVMRPQRPGLSILAGVMQHKSGMFPGIVHQCVGQPTSLTTAPPSPNLALTLLRTSTFTTTPPPTPTDRTAASGRRAPLQAHAAARGGRSRRRRLGGAVDRGGLRHHHPDGARRRTPRH